MIVILAKGKTTQVLVSPKSKGWLAPGDKHFPGTDFESDEAFTTEWKKLNKQGYKDTEYISSQPKKKPAKEQRYTVKVSGTVDPLYKAFAAWAKTQTYGAVGYFEVITGKIPKEITDDAALVKTGRALLSLPDGSLIVANAAGELVALDSEGGKPKRIATGMRPFLEKLAKGKTGVSDLDDEDATGRKALKAWLADQA